MASMITDALTIRPVHDDDSAGLIALIGAVFSEYPGCVLDVDREEPMLRRPTAWAAELCGCWWVAEASGAVVATIAVVHTDAPMAELKKLYVARTQRRRGLGAQLVDLAEQAARRGGARDIELWTDTRFADAHRLYERLGYAKQPKTRALNDLSATIEFHYRKTLV